MTAHRDPSAVSAIKPRRRGWFAKALGAARHSGASWFFMGPLRRARVDYVREVGDMLDASVVTAPVQWIARAFVELKLRVVRRAAGGVEALEGHPLAALVARPNAFYSAEALWGATIASYLTAGNAYWLIVRNRAFRPIELWYAPHWTIEPKWPDDGSAFLSHYEYKPGGGVPNQRLEIEDVIHFRHGLNPRNPRQGLSPLHGVIREIFGDLEASTFTAALLRNMGVPGLVIAPDGGVQAAPEDVDATKAWLRQAFTGERRGEPLVMGAATKVQQFGFTPQQMDLSVVRDVSEERVCAALGIPAAVVGFGAGLQTAKVGATMNELRRLAWVNGVLPIGRSFARELDRSLLPAFGDSNALRSEFDTTEVTALEEDREVRARTWTAMVAGGWAMVGEGREGMGLDVDDSHNVFLRPFSAIEVPAHVAPRRGGAPRSPFETPSKRSRKDAT